MKPASLWLLPAFFLPLALPMTTPGATPTSLILEDTETAEQYLEPEVFLKVSGALPSPKPAFDIHGDYRWLFGKGRFNGDYGGKRVDVVKFMEQRRLRLFPEIHITPEVTLKSMLEDDRYDKDKEDNPDHHVFLSRLYLEYVNDSFKVEAGRFNYFLADGNVIDKKVDGIRLRYKHSDSPTGRFAFFYGKTVAHGSAQKEGYIIENKREAGKWLSHLSYLHFHTTRDRSPSKNPFQRDARFDEQRIGEWSLAYSPNQDWQVGLDLLYSYGKHNADNHRTHEKGYVISLLHGEANPQKAGTWEAWIRYYNQPSSSIIAHTMDGDTTFFQRMGFKGWGVRCDYVLTRGLVWAVEGFALENKKNTPYTDHLHEYILGTSLTAYF